MGARCRGSVRPWGRRLSRIADHRSADPHGSDRMHLAELHPRTRGAGRALAGPAPMLAPPDAERRWRWRSPRHPGAACLLIDPSYEVKTEYAATARLIGDVARKWNVGVICWYPILGSGRATGDARIAGAAGPAPRTLRHEVRFPPAREGRRLDRKRHVRRQRPLRPSGGMRAARHRVRAPIPLIHCPFPKASWTDRAPRGLQGFPCFCAFGRHMAVMKLQPAPVFFSGRSRTMASSCSGSARPRRPEPLYPNRMILGDTIEQEGTAPPHDNLVSAEAATEYQGVGWITNCCADEDDYGNALQALLSRFPGDRVDLQHPGGGQPPRPCCAPHGRHPRADRAARHPRRSRAPMPSSLAASGMRYPVLVRRPRHRRPRVVPHRSSLRVGGSFSTPGFAGRTT